MNLQKTPLPKAKEISSISFYDKYPGLEYTETIQGVSCGRSPSRGVVVIYKRKEGYSDRKYRVFHEFKWGDLRRYSVTESQWFKALLSKAGRRFYSRSTTGAVLMAWSEGGDTWQKFLEEIPCNINPLNTRTDNMGNPTPTTLFEVKGKKNVFGIFLAKRPNGEYVLEMKDGSGAEAFSKDDLVEVLPYTVSIKYLSDRGSTASYDYECEEGKVEKGDLLVINGQLAQVTGIDTKSKSAHKTLTGRKLTTEAI